MLSSSLLGIVFTVVGLALSYALNLTSGATIILVAATGYLVSLVVRLLVEKRRRRTRTLSAT